MSSDHKANPPTVVECSPAAPWGIHSVLTEERCERCGWYRRGASEKDSGGDHVSNATRGGGLDEPERRWLAPSGTSSVGFGPA